MIEKLTGISALRVGLLVLIVASLTALVWGIVSERDGFLHRYWQRYVVSLERRLRVLFIFTPGWKIALGQVVGGVLAAVLAFWFEFPWLYLLIPLILVVPPLQIDALRKKRVTAIDGQLVDFLTGLANELKAIPNVSTAFENCHRLIRDPLRQELQLAVKEIRLGSTLDQALLSISRRVGSRDLDVAVSAIIVGKQVGGDLPSILERTAAAMREMQRLEGVVRTKTAEGRMQLWVLALCPAGFLFAFNAVKPGYFAPLTESMMGYGVALVSAVLWVGAIVLARNILAVKL